MVEEEATNFETIDLDANTQNITKKPHTNLSFEVGNTVSNYLKSRLPKAHSKVY